MRQPTRTGRDAHDVEEGHGRKEEGERGREGGERVKWTSHAFIRETEAGECCIGHTHRSRLDPCCWRKNIQIIK